MTTTSADRNLLFAALALQNNLVTADSLAEAINIWAFAKDRPIGEILVAQGRLSAEDQKLLDTLFERQGLPETTQSTIDVGSSVHEVSKAQDADVGASSADAARTGAYSSVDSGYAHNRDTGDQDGSRAGQAALANPALPRYRILRPHARGGLGEVYVAEDVELRREVALKEIRGRHAGSEVNRLRFIAEAEITGRLEHPGIVPVYGLGSYEDGRPFYAMRFIQGDDLQAVAQRFHDSGGRFDSLEFRHLLGRFVDVCDAVAYAHSRGVLHRDLKPRNVMLGKYGETLVVDWGLAKIVGQHGDDHGEAIIAPVSGSGLVETLAGSAVGTPAYMSPEQADGKIEELGPATDIYSLGATLFAVLTGRPPVAGESAIEVLEKVRRGDVAFASKVRPGVPAALAAVCAKAMALRPVDRYPHPQALSADVEHWLADEPVAAMPDPLAVRARRWARKHPGAVAGLAAALVMGVTGLGSGLYFVSAERTRTEIARKEAVERQEETESVLKFVESRVFAAARPTDQRGLGRDVTLKAAVQAAMPFVADGFKDQPLTEARLRMTMGTSFLYLGNAVAAEEQLSRARDIWTARLGPDNVDTLRSMTNLAIVYDDLGRPADALALKEEVLRRRRATLGREHPSTLGSMNNLAVSYARLGRVADAMALIEETLAIQKARLGPDHPDTLSSLNNLANTYAALGRTAEALALREQLYRLRLAKFGPDHPDTRQSMTNLANSYAAVGRPADALALREETLKLNRAKLGPDHLETLRSMTNLADTYEALGRVQSALTMREENLRLMKAKYGPDHVDTLTCMGNLAMSYAAVGRVAEAVALDEQTLRLRKIKLGPDHPLTLVSMSNLGTDYVAAGRPADALPLREETLRLQKAKLGPDHPDTLSGMNSLAGSYVTAGREDEALALVDDALKRSSSQPGIDRAVVAGLLEVRMVVLQHRGDLAGCQATAEKWEGLGRRDADSLFRAARYRAISSGVANRSSIPEKARLADGEADRAMTWLRQAIAAGYRDIASLTTDPDFASLRQRADFTGLLWELADTSAAPAKP